MSHDAVTARLALHLVTATAACPTLTGKRITPHVLRHTAAMRLLNAGIDSTVIALWLGHESIETTQVYLHANIKTKEDALARTRPTGASPGRYTVTDDTLLAFLDGLWICRHPNRPSPTHERLTRSQRHNQDIGIKRVDRDLGSRQAGRDRLS